jgi:hypothetical protein
MKFLKIESRGIVDKTPDAIIEFAAAQATKAWDKNQSPYLLARLSPDLVAQGIEYKEVLGEQKLKDFLRKATDKVKVVIHPTQAARIGLIPPDKFYEYSTEAAPAEESATTSPRSERPNLSRKRYIVMNFLQLVSELDEAEAAQINIPTNILIKLMRDR